MRRKVPSEGAGRIPRGVRRQRAAIEIDEAVGPPSAPVSAAMTRDVPCVAEDMSVDSLAGFLLERELIGVPVVDGEGQLAGFVSLFDLEREHFQRGDTGESAPLRAKSRGYAYELPDGYHADPIAHATVSEVMTPEVPAVVDSTPIATAAAMMATEHLEALPVVSPVGYVVGVLFAVDVVRWFAQQNGYVVPTRPLRVRGPANEEKTH
jgi:CBS domain-containing protein